MTKQADIEAIMHESIAAITAIEWQSPLAILNSFPNGGCTLSSFYLGHLLESRGYGQWHIVNSTRGVMENHDWLESSDGLVVDATPQQFEDLDFPAPFVVQVPSPLERHFTRLDNHELDSWTEAYERGYAIFLAALDAVERNTPSDELFR